MATAPYNHSGSNRMVPSVVAEKISDVVKRTRRTRLLTGAVVAFATALVVMLIAIGIDWGLVLFEPAQRAQLTSTSLIAMGALGLCCVGLAALGRLSKLDAAHQIDEQVPQLQERWASVTEFSAVDATPEMRGSEVFIRKVAQEAVELEHIVQPAQIHLGKHLTLALGGLGVVAGLWLVALLCDPGHVSVLVRRFLSPQSAISLTEIKSESGDVVQPRGSRLKLEARVSGRQKSAAQIAIRRSGENDEIVALTALNDDPSRFAFPIKDLQSPFAYRFRAGDGQSSWHQVKIADRPTLKVIDFKIIPPAYSGLPELRQEGLPKTVKVLQGSRLVLQIEPSIPLTSLALQQENNASVMLALNDANVYRWESVLKETFAFRPVLLSVDGLTNSQPPRCEIVIFRDQAPTVEVANPTNDIALRPDDSVTISFDAKDDLGISKAELVIYDPSKEGNEVLKTIPIPLNEQEGDKSIHAQVELDLKDFHLKQGEQLTYAIRVYDTKNEAATQQSGDSPELTAEQQAKADDSKASETKPQEKNSLQADDPKNERQIASNSSSDRPENQKSNSNSKSNRSQQRDSEQLDKQRESEKSQTGKEKQQDEKQDDEEPPKDQAGGGNTWKPKSSSDEKSDDPPKGEVGGAPRPDFLMSKRELDTPAGQCTSCSRRKITIDEWAGSFASQVLDKLQLQIDPVLKDLKKSLTQARDTLQPIADQAKPVGKWQPADGLVVRTGDGFLDESEKQVKELTVKTDATPYAFIGLQLKDIAQLHIQPAREHLSDVTLFDKPSKADDLTASVVHIQRAIGLLEKLTREYEAVKLNQKLADTMLRIKKMHQIFLEGTFAMLASQKPNLNPKERAFLELELTEEFLRKLQELLNKKLEIQAELAKVLSQDPRLLERFMARSRLEATTLRDQLTLLHGRQRTFTQELTEALPAAKNGKGKLEFKNRVLKRADLAAQISEEVATMFDNYVVWTPMNQDVNKGALATHKAVGVKLVANASELAKLARGQSTEKAIESGVALYEQLLEWQTSLPSLLGDEVDAKMQTHIANRLQETEKLITDVSGWVIKEQAMEAGEEHVAAEVDQHRIAVDTMILTRKLNNLNAQCQGISVDLAQLAKSFLKTMEEDLVPELEDSQRELSENHVPEAIKHQTSSIEHFAKAEQQLDEIMDGIIKHLDSLPVNEKPELGDDVQPQSLDELLAMLEDEEKAAEALGIPCCRPSNLIIEKDWFKPGSNPGGGGKGGSGPRSFRPKAPMDQSKMANQRAERVRKEMEDALKKLNKSGGLAKKGGTPEKPERKWDTLGSKLEDHVRQGRGNLPPEQYRKAIELYFESLAGKSKAEPKGD